MAKVAPAGGDAAGNAAGGRTLQNAFRFGEASPFGTVDPNRVTQSQVDDVQSIDDFILGTLPNQITLRPYHDMRCFPCCVCTPEYQFDVASTYFGDRAGYGKVTDKCSAGPCRACCNPVVEVNLPNETITGKWENQCGCRENRWTLKLSTGEYVSLYSAGCCILYCPSALTKCCSYRVGYHGNAEGEDDKRWRYIAGGVMKVPNNKKPCCPCCGGKNTSEIHSATHAPTTPLELKTIVALRHSLVTQSELDEPYPSSVNGTVDYRLSYKKVCCRPFGVCCNYRLMDPETSPEDSAKQSAIDVRFRGSFNQNDADDKDARIMLALGLFRMMLLERALFSSLPTMINNELDVHHTPETSPFLEAMAHQVPSILAVPNKSKMV